MDKQVIRVREKGTDNSIHELDVTGRGRRSVERIIDGMNINLDHDRYYVDDTTAYPDVFDD